MREYRYNTCLTIGTMLLVWAVLEISGSKPGFEPYVRLGLGIILLITGFVLRKRPSKPN
jgi:hypothetical protein